MTQVRQTQLEIETAAVLSRSSGGQGPSHPDKSLAWAHSLIAWLAGLLLARRIQRAATLGGSGAPSCLRHTARLLEMPLKTSL